MNIFDFEYIVRPYCIQRSLNLKKKLLHGVNDYILKTKSRTIVNNLHILKVFEFLSLTIPKTSPLLHKFKY
jgi:hypothetical protein